jgi:DNA polymerase-3 subunit delta'
MMRAILGQDLIHERFRKALSRDRLASTFLFVGQDGVGKRAFAHFLAQALLCEQSPPPRLEPCGTCPACQQVAAETHPDLEIVRKPAERAALPIELLVGDREHRMQEGLCHKIALKPFRGGRKVAIIEDADYLFQEGANAILKTLEEPPRKSVIILISSSEQRQLPTIRSRCQVVRFQPLEPHVIQTILLREGWVSSDEEAQRLAALAQGSLERVRWMLNAELREFEQSLRQYLTQSYWEPLPLAAQVTSNVNAAGKEAASRRERFRQIVGFAADFYRQAMHAATDPAAETNPPSNPLRIPAELAARCVERCLEADLQIQANANQATLVEAWIDALAEQHVRASTAQRAASNGR